MKKKTPLRFARQERARRSGLSRLKKNGGITMANKRVGLCFKDWQISILEELAKREGFEHLATFITRDLFKLYPTLNRKPLPDSRQMNLLAPASSRPAAGLRLAGPGRPRASGQGRQKAAGPAGGK